MLVLYNGWVISFLLLALAALNPLQALLVEKSLELPGVQVSAQNQSAPRHLSGYFRLDRTHDARMFYFFFEAREAREDTPVVLWMTGGPGCSSELAVFYENGPYYINKDLSLRESPYGWDVNHNMIFVDQPIGTGFSYSSDERDTVHDEKGVADDMLQFLQEFFAKHPDMGKRDLYITGESYAGHYVPAVASKVFQEDKNIRLKGIAIGNGMTDPAIQLGAYADFAYQNGMISEFLKDKIDMVYPACKAAIDICNGHEWKVECLLAMQFCQGIVVVPIQLAAGDFNVYDIRKECIGPLCYDFSRLEQYLAQTSVRKALGVGDQKWELCSPTVQQDMMGDWLMKFDTVIPALLEGGVRVMIYAGEKDFICNWLGNQRWVDILPWAGADAWREAKEEEWGVDDKVSGTVRSAGALTFVKVHDAGHMVPMDQPHAALSMLTAFTRNTTLPQPGPRPDTDVRQAGGNSGTRRVGRFSGGGHGVSSS